MHKRAPDPSRECGSLPVTLTFVKSLGVSVLLLPMGRGDDVAPSSLRTCAMTERVCFARVSSTNEKLDCAFFIESSKV